ncbi:MAG: hypothetical protein ACRCZI_05845 [Cetobacterium sp.]
MSEQRFLIAAREWAEAEAEISRLYRGRQRCPAICNGDPSVGDPGSGECGDLDDCEACRANHEAWHGSAKWRKRKGYARRRMLKWRLAEPAPTVEQYRHRYPFIRFEYKEFVIDGEGVTSAKVPSWKPGVKFEDYGSGGTEALCDGIGEQVLTVISRHKPGKFPERVFYTRQWISPEGTAFGKGGLKVTTADAFRRLCGGYRYEFTVREGSR